MVAVLGSAAMLVLVFILALVDKYNDRHDNEILYGDAEKYLCKSATTNKKYMTTQSNFEKDIATREERRHLASVRKEKQTDFYHAIAKIIFTALVVGVIVMIIQSPEKTSWQHYVTLLLGVLFTMLAYQKGNNKLK